MERRSPCCSASFWPLHGRAVAAGVLVMALGDGLCRLLGAAADSPSWSWRVPGGSRKSLARHNTHGLVGLACSGPCGPPSTWGARLPTASLAGIAVVGQTAGAGRRSSGSTNLSVPVIPALSGLAGGSGLKHAFTAVLPIVVCRGRPPAGDRLAS